MSDYIKREDAIQAMAKAVGRMLYDAEAISGHIMNSIPSADVVEVVRCKDCANYAGDGMYCAWNVLTGDMGYCHHGYTGGDAITGKVKDNE